MSDSGLIGTLSIAAIIVAYWLGYYVGRKSVMDRAIDLVMRAHDRIYEERKGAGGI